MYMTGRPFLTYAGKEAASQMIKGTSPLGIFNARRDVLVCRNLWAAERGEDEFHLDAGRRSSEGKIR
jgi:hypothetical protein